MVWVVFVGDFAYFEDVVERRGIAEDVRCSEGADVVVGLSETC